MSESRWMARRKYHEAEIEENRQSLAALDVIGDMPGIESIYAWGWSKKIEVTASPAQVGHPPIDARTLALQIVGRMKSLGQVPPMVSKSFDSSNGKITYSIPGPLPGWKIQISGGEPRCKVRKEVEVVEIPEQVKPAETIAAHTETKVKYVIENPEECGAEGA